MKLQTGLSAVVTGGASGLGEATARHLASQGVKVAIFDLNETLGNQVATDINGLFCSVDVSDSASVQQGFTNARKTYGQEHIAVNCAGIVPVKKTVSRGEPHDAALYAKVIGINLIGSFNVASQAAAGMVTNEPGDNGECGVIISTASVAAYEGQIGQTAYAASKGGIVGMTLPMARDLADKGVRVMAIAPGIMKTPMVASFPEDVQQALAAQIPFPSRLGEPDEFARLVVHICENQFLNGEVIRLDGAIRMTPR